MGRNKLALSPKKVYTKKNIARRTLKSPNHLKDKKQNIKGLNSKIQNNTQNDKIDKLKENIADNFFQAKADNFISIAKRKNIVRNDTPDDEEETEEGGLEISETGM